MNHHTRLASLSDAEERRRETNDQVDPSETLLVSATRWAHVVGQNLGRARRWVETEAIGNRPVSTLAFAFGIGVLTGWLIKRR